MRKLVLFCVVMVVALFLPACNGKTEEIESISKKTYDETQESDVSHVVTPAIAESPQTSPEKTIEPNDMEDIISIPTSEPITFDEIQEYMVFPTREGLVREKCDLTNKMLLVPKNEYSEYLGMYEMWVYYLNDEYSLCKIDLNGEKQKIISEEAYYATKLEDQIFFIDNNIVYEVHFDDNLSSVLEIPDNL